MKHIFNNIRLITLALILAFAASYANAAFSLPSGTPPQNSAIAVPVHTGRSQIRSGSLSVGDFISASTSSFDQDIFIEEQTIYGGTPTSSTSTIKFGSTDTVHVQSNGSIKVKSYIQSQGLATGEIKELCADTEGNIVICP